MKNRNSLKLPFLPFKLQSINEILEVNVKFSDYFTKVIVEFSIKSRKITTFKLHVQLQVIILPLFSMGQSGTKEHLGMRDTSCAEDSNGHVSLITNKYFLILFFHYYRMGTN